MHTAKNNLKICILTEPVTVGENATVYSPYMSGFSAR